MLGWIGQETLQKTLTSILGAFLGGLGLFVSLLSASRGFDLIL
jgi:hypothetical protein